MATETVLYNESELHFVDISSEEWREYIFPDGTIVRIPSPQWLSVKDSGSARILDINDLSHYIPAGWIHLRWRRRPNQPHFVC